jgi:hypothetical protein
MEWFDKMLVHWPFIAAMAVFMLIGLVMNKQIFSAQMCKDVPRAKWLWWWARKTLPLHPVISGIALGFIWYLPEAGVDSIVERCAYFGFAGALSVFLYEAAKGLLKKRGIDLELPGETTTTITTTTATAIATTTKPPAGDAPPGQEG